MRDISHDLTAYFREMGVSQGDIAERLGVSQAYVSGLLSGKKAFGKKQAQRFHELFGISPNWLLTGIGPMFDDAPRNEPDTVPLLPVFAQAGSLVGWSEGTEEARCERVISPVKDVDMAVHVYGESMYPDIPNGSVVYVRRVSGRIIDWGRAYILDTVDGPVLKYLSPGSDEEHLRCVSANHDPRYAPFEVAREDVLGIYRVVMCMSMK